MLFRTIARNARPNLTRLRQAHLHHFANKMDLSKIGRQINADKFFASYKHQLDMPVYYNPNHNKQRAATALAEIMDIVGHSDLWNNRVKRGMCVDKPCNMHGDSEMRDVISFFFGNGLNPEVLKDYFKIIYHWTPKYDKHFDHWVSWIGKPENRDKWSYYDIMMGHYN